MTQLCRFEDHDDAASRWRTESYGDERKLLISSHADQTGVSVRFDSAPHTGLPLRFRLRVVPPIGVDATAVDLPDFWSMAKGIPMPAGPRAKDVFAQIVSRAHDELYSRDYDPRPTAVRRRTDAERAEASRTMRGIYAHMRSLAMHAANRCNPAARSLALRFPIHLRLAAYQRIAEDRSGRIAQLAIACPGALGFSLALMDRGAVDVGERLLAGVVEGRRINPVLDEAVEAWAESLREHVMRSEVPRERNPLWRRVARANRVELRCIRATQRLLLRRAAPAVSGAYLWLPPPIFFAPEDVPRAVRANAAWFRVTKCTGITLYAAGEPDEALRFALARFTSRHASAIWSARRRSRPIRDEVIELRDYLAAAGRFPSTRTDPFALMRESRRWHADVHRAELALRDVEEVDPAILEKPFPEPPLPAWKSAGVEVRAIANAKELIAEGRQMRNCVSARLDEIAAGRSAIYHAEVHGRPITIEILRRADGLELGDFRGFANRAPTKTERAALAPWLRACGAARRGASAVQ
jgi:hypothetical protein